VKYIIPQTRSVPLISDSPIGEGAQRDTHTHTNTHTYTHTVSPDIEIRWQGGHRNCKLAEIQYFPNNKIEGDEWGEGEVVGE